MTKTRTPARLLARALLAMAMGLTGLVVSQSISPVPAEAGTACAPLTRSLGGTVEGEDGRYISSLIGISLFTANGTKVYPNGCMHTAPGYSMVVKVNTYAQPGLGYILPGDGSTSDTYFDGNTTHNLTKSWSAPNLASNISYAWTEIYTGGSDGVPNEPSNLRYGHTRRRPVPINDNNIQYRQPLNCGLSENGVTGMNGEIHGRVFDNGNPVTPTKVIAFNTLLDNTNNGRLVGFNSLNDHDNDRYVIPSLSPGPYKVYIYNGGGPTIVEDVVVDACETTYEDIAISGKTPGIPDWARTQIYWLLDNGYATGYPDNTFRPDNRITRAQVANMIYGIANGTPTGGDCGNLTDVPPWARDAICWMVDNGHMTGYDDLTFRPDEFIRRAAVTRMLYRVTGGAATSGDCGNITDVPAWAAVEVCWAVDLGHMSGYPDQTFRPNRSITRAQTGNVLYNLFNVT